MLGTRTTPQSQKLINHVQQHVTMNVSILPILAVAAGGAIGAILRFGVYKTVDASFPWATVLVNLTGCLMASFLMFRFGIDMSDTLRTFLFIGVFGAFTTMSTFSIDVVNLMTAGSYGGALAHIALNSVVCVGAAFGGRYLALL